MAGLVLVSSPPARANGIGSRGVNIEVPAVSTRSDVESNPATTIQENENTRTAYVNLINFYLWFSIGIVAMAVLVIGGYKLITANGDAKAMSAANQMLMNAGIGIVVSMLAYTLIRVIVNLF